MDSYCSFALTKLLADKKFPNAVEYINYLQNESGQWHTYFPSVPTHSIALKWLRECESIFIGINYNSHSNLYSGNIVYNNKRYQVPKSYSDSYDDCVEETMIYCLKNFVKTPIDDLKIKYI